MAELKPFTPPTGSADDNADIAAGTVPRSLRIDAIHYSGVAHQYIA